MKTAEPIPRDEARTGATSPAERAAASAATRERVFSLAALPSGYGLRVAAQRTVASFAAVWPSAVAVVALLLLWQGYVVVSGVDQQLLPTPTAVWSALTTQREALWTNTLVTLWETLIGFGAALATGIAFGIAIDLSPWLRRAHPVSRRSRIRAPTASRTRCSSTR